jgi:succinylglutamate desuccinylase
MDSLEIPLHLTHTLPAVLSDLESTGVREAFTTPTIIELEGRRKDPLFVSFLLHGNETTSFYVLKKLQAYLQTHPLQRSLILFVGNVYAAEAGVRFLEGQSDYNRVWLPGSTAEHDLAKRVLDHVSKGRKLFASVDIHNNTGKNPFYACINHLEDSSIYLGSLFSKTLVFFQNPDSAQSVVFSKICPSVTLECGQSGQQEGIEKAFQYLLDVIHLESLEHPSFKQEPQIFETVGRILLKEMINYSFDFSETDDPLQFAEDFESLNFGFIEAGSSFAKYQGQEPPFHVLNDNNQDVFEEYFAIYEGHLRVKKDFVPSMLTQNKDVIRQDCLGYIMRKI